VGPYLAFVDSGGHPDGSYLAIMHPASDLDPALLEAGQRWNQLAAQPVRLRSRADMTLPGGS
jgi:hypothetical protein